MFNLYRVNFDITCLGSILLESGQGSSNSETRSSLVHIFKKQSRRDTRRLGSQHIHFLHYRHLMSTMNPCILKQEVNATLDSISLAFRTCFLLFIPAFAFLKCKVEHHGISFITHGLLAIVETNVEIGPIK